MNIDAITDGIVIDHIKAGQGMELYHDLGLENLDCSVALIKNAPSKKMGKKDIIKVNAALDLNVQILGFIDPDITVNIIRNGTRVEKFHPELPLEITNVIKCRNPRCISTVEPGITHIFKLTDKEKRIYRCIYCESKAKSKDR